MKRTRRNEELMMKRKKYMELQEYVSSIVSKKSKDDFKEKPDLLSELPESLLVKIISLLPIEEAVRTGVLSTRWNFFWKHMDKFVYDLTRSKNRTSLEKQRNFISFVDHTLKQCVCPKTVSLITLQFDEDCFLHECLGRWLQWVYSRKVENLKVHIWKLSYAPPEWFYHNSNLVKLNISHWNFTNLGPIVSWTSLKSLSLRSAAIGDEQLSIILSGCPLLEDLELFDISLNSLNITSPHLVKLYVCYLWVKVAKGLFEINAPWLQFLNFSGHLRSTVVRLINVSSLVCANLDFAINDHVLLDVASKFLESVHHVQKLTIGERFIPALSLLKLSGVPCPLLKCKRLTFILPILRHELPGIAYLLKSSHHLETLVIEARNYFTGDIEKRITEMCDFEAETYLSIESGDFPHLKSIEVTYCICDIEAMNNRRQKCFVFELVAYILRKAPVLEKLVIASQEGYCKCYSICAREYASNLIRELFELFVDHEEVGAWKVMKKKSYFEILF